MITFPALLDRKSGSIVIQQHNIIFNSDDETAKNIVLSISRLKITLGGQNSTHYYLSDPHHPEQVICIQDQKVLLALSKLGNASAKINLEKTRKIKFWRNLSLSTPIIITVFLIFLIPLIISFIPISWFNNMITFKQEQKLGRTLFPLMRTELKISENHPAHNKIKKLVQFIQTETPELSNLEIETYISTKSIAGRLGNLAGILFLTLFVGTDAVGVIASVNNFVTLKYSREDEAEADRRGFEFLTNAKIAPTGMINFFNRLSDKENSIGNSLAFLSNHPRSEERVEALNKLKDRTVPFEARTLPMTLQQLRNF